MSDQNNDQLVDQSDCFFEEPALLTGEDRTKTLKMLNAVAGYIEPEDVFEQMMVNDTVNYYWEEMRFRRISAALIESAKPEALEVLLRPFFDAGTIFIRHRPRLKSPRAISTATARRAKRWPRSWRAAELRKGTSKPRQHSSSLIPFSSSIAWPATGRSLVALFAKTMTSAASSVNRKRPRIKGTPQSHGHRTANRR